jgi:hypothetical protein
MSTPPSKSIVGHIVSFLGFIVVSILFMVIYLGYFIVPSILLAVLFSYLIIKLCFGNIMSENDLIKAKQIVFYFIGSLFIIMCVIDRGAIFYRTYLTYTEKNEMFPMPPPNKRLLFKATTSYLGELYDGRVRAISNHPTFKYNVAAIEKGKFGPYRKQIHNAEYEVLSSVTYKFPNEAIAQKAHRNIFIRATWMRNLFWHPGFPQQLFDCIFWACIWMLNPIFNIASIVFEKNYQKQVEELKVPLYPVVNYSLMRD